MTFQPISHALLKHGHGSQQSDHLTNHHGRNSGKQRDAKGGQRILALGHGDRRDDTCTQAGNGQLGRKFGAAIHGTDLNGAYQLARTGQMA